MGTLIKLLLGGLGPLEGYKTYIGMALTAISAALWYMDANHPAIDLIAAIMVGLGLGDKVGKQRAADEAGAKKGKK